MSSAGPAEPRPRDEVLADAVRVLTEAVRLRQPDPTGSGRWPIDWADFLAAAITAAAANAGGVATALEGRPGSWEAELIRKLVVDTAGEELTALARYRTEPLRITVRPAEILNDLGYDRLYDNSAQAIDDLRRPHQWRWHRQADDTWQALDDDAPPFPYSEHYADPSYQSVGIVTEARTPADEAVLEQLDTFEADLDLLRDTDDPAAYGAALAEQARRAAGDLLPGQTVEVVVNLDFRGPGEQAEAWDELVEQILETTQASTPLPWSGIAPQDYPPVTPIADTERAAGRLPHLRLLGWPPAGLDESQEGTVEPGGQP